MIQISVDSLRFGGLAVRSAPWDAYEVIRLTTPGSGIVSARVELIKGDHPALRVETPDRVERFLHAESMATVSRVVLGKWSDDEKTDFELVLKGAEDLIEFHLHGHREYHLFGWRLEFQLLKDQFLTRGPHLESDPNS